MVVLVAVRAAASRQRLLTRAPGQVVLRVEGEREVAIGGAEAPQVPVRRAAHEDTVADRLDEPYQPGDLRRRPGPLVFRVQHQERRPGRGRADDRDRVAQGHQLRAAPRRVMGDDEVVAGRAEVDLDPGDTLAVTLAKPRERVLRVLAAPGRPMDLELHDAAVARTDERPRLRLVERALPSQARRAPLAGSKRCSCSGAKRRPTRSPIFATKPGGAMTRSRRSPT